MASRETGPSVPSPYDPGTAGGAPSRPGAGGSGTAFVPAGGKPPWNSPPDVMSLLRSLARHWVKALLLGLFLGASAAALTWVFYPKPKYAASAYLEVASKTPTTLPGSTPVVQDTPFELFISSEMQRLKLDRVLRRALDNLESLVFDPDASGAKPSPASAPTPKPAAGADAVADADADAEAAPAPGPEAEATATTPDAGGRPAAVAGSLGLRRYRAIFGDVPPLDWLRENLQVTTNGNFIVVTLRSETRAGLHEIVNEIAQAYITDIEEERSLETSKFNELKKLADRYEKDLQASRKRMQELTLLGLDPESPTTYALTRQLGLERQSEVLSQYNRLKSDLKRAEAELEGLRTLRAAPERLVVSDEDVDDAFESQPAVQELRAQIEEYTRRIEDVRFTSRKENDAAIIKFQQQRKVAQARLEQYRRELRPELLEQLREGAMNGGAETGTTAARQVASLTREIGILTEFKRELEAELELLAKQTAEQAKNAAEMFKIQNDFKFADRAADLIRARLSELDVEKDAPSRVRISDLASEPSDRADLKKKFMATLMAGGGLFGASLFMVAMLEFRTRRVKAPEEVVRALGMSVVGTIPALPDQRLRRPGNATQLTDSRWQQAFMESVDATRMLLLHMSRSEGLRAVMITSASSGEGKTSLSCYLGGSLARAVHRTLIVDCDLRRPAVHQVFDTPQEPGLCDLLRGEAEIQDIIRPTPIDGLFVIPAGRLDGRAMLSMSKGELGPILAWLKEQYDFVIVDAPPVLAVADTLQLSQHVDAVLFSILRDVSRMPEVYEARERLATMNIRVLGAVVSGTPLVGNGYNRRYAYYGEKVST
jgi:capsular exopolysaccharide synthesis family protein